MTSPVHHSEFRTLASELDRIDVAAYRAAEQDPLEPIIGYGPPKARLGIFGRDPGRHEVIHQRPFVGAGGQLVRQGLYRHLYGAEMPDFEASLAVGEHVFWANTVPYKPVGNKAWGIRVKRRFAPLMADVLVHGWSGRDLLVLGRDAFFWFGLEDREQAHALDEFWKRPDRYEATFEALVVARDGTERKIRLHPLPHPSPLNATWYKHVPELLRNRLEALDWQLGQTLLR